MEVRPQNTPQQPRTTCNSLAEDGLHPCSLALSSLLSKISSPPPLSFHCPLSPLILFPTLLRKHNAGAPLWSPTGNQLEMLPGAHFGVEEGGCRALTLSINPGRKHLKTG